MKVKFAWAVLLVVAGCRVAWAENPATTGALPPIIPTYQDAPFSVRYSMAATLQEGDVRLADTRAQVAILPAGEWVFVRDGDGAVRHDSTVRTALTEGSPASAPDAQPIRRRSVAILGTGRIVARSLHQLQGTWEPEPVVEVGSGERLSRIDGAAQTAQFSYPAITYAKLNNSTGGASGFDWLDTMMSMPVVSVTPGRNVTVVEWAREEGGRRWTATARIDAEGYIRGFDRTTTSNGVTTAFASEFAEVRLVDGYQVPWQVNHTVSINGRPVTSVTATVLEFHSGTEAAERIPVILPEEGDVQEVQMGTGASTFRAARTRQDYESATL